MKKVIVLSGLLLSFGLMATAQDSKRINKQVHLSKESELKVNANSVKVQGTPKVHPRKVETGQAKLTKSIQSKSVNNITPQKAVANKQVIKKVEGPVRIQPVKEQKANK